MPRDDTKVSNTSVKHLNKICRAYSNLDRNCISLFLLLVVSMAMKGYYAVVGLEFEI